MSTDEPAAFAGFPVAGLDFYDDLEADNTKVFWTSNRQVYLDAVRTPMTALLAELEPEFALARCSVPTVTCDSATTRPHTRHTRAVSSRAASPAGGMWS